jgi:DNA-binding NarL/FixJ family response regulator
VHTVLVADDHAQVRELVCRALDHEPDLVVVANACNGADAVQLAAQLEPDVVVMDLSMPVLDGVEATRRLRSRADPPAIVALTASHAMGRRALAAGASCCVYKDAPPCDLLAAVREAASAA